MATDPVYLLELIASYLITTMLTLHAWLPLIHTYNGGVDWLELN